MGSKRQCWGGWWLLGKASAGQHLWKYFTSRKNHQLSGRAEGLENVSGGEGNEESGRNECEVTAWECPGWEGRPQTLLREGLKVPSTHPAAAWGCSTAGRGSEAPKPHPPLPKGCFLSQGRVKANLSRGEILQLWWESRSPSLGAVTSRPCCSWDRHPWVPFS